MTGDEAEEIRMSAQVRPDSAPAVGAFVAAGGNGEDGITPDRLFGARP